MSRRSEPARKRIGQVSFYEHHGGHWVYYRQDGKPHRELIGASAAAAECVASLLNALLVAASTGVVLDQIVREHLADRAPFSRLGQRSTGENGEVVVQATISELRQRFLLHHEEVLHSSLNTVSRYRSATLYLEQFGERENYANAGEVQVASFIQYLRAIEVSPNGHSNTARRKLRDKGIRFILECSRSLFHFAIRSGAVPRGFTNPFSGPDLGRIRVRDAKPIFVFSADQELQFFQAAKPWAFRVHFVLAKTGMRPGELVRLLIEDIDWKEGWITIRGKPELGWVTKTNRERRIPAVPEVIQLLRELIGERQSGVLFLRQKFSGGDALSLRGGRTALAKVAEQRIERQEVTSPKSCRTQAAKAYASVWADAGALSVDHVRVSFIQTARKAGLHATCPKSWRHTFATLLQEANVDVLVRQETLGHKPSEASSSALGMTGVYTHTTPDFHKREIHRALQQREITLALVNTYMNREEPHEN